MYKVSYYIGKLVSFKWFETLHDACLFANNIGNGDVIEIKLYKDLDEISNNH